MDKEEGIFSSALRNLTIQESTPSKSYPSGNIISRTGTVTLSNNNNSTLSTPSSGSLSIPNASIDYDTNAYDSDITTSLSDTFASTVSTGAVPSSVNSSSSSSSSSTSVPSTPSFTPSTPSNSMNSNAPVSRSSLGGNLTSSSSVVVRGSVRYNGKGWDDNDILPSRVSKLQRLLEGRNIDIEALRTASWGGIPSKYRTAVWQMLLGYLPLNRDRQNDSIARKHAEYQQFVNTLCGPRSTDRGSSSSASSSTVSALSTSTPNMSESDAALLRQVLYDVKRMSPHTKLVQIDVVQRALERVLYVFAQRHFATGYVQGINDLAAPFFLVFLSPWADETSTNLDHVDPEVLMGIEADVYWCLSRLIEGMQDHYMPSQPGIQRMIHQLRELVHRMDEQLVMHLEANSVEFHTFAFRWMNCLLLRELPLRLVVRLWDTYMAEMKNSIKDGFGNFHIFVCAALLLKFRNKLKEMKFQDLLQFLHNLPTTDWNIKDIEELLSQAYVYMSSFEGSPSHLK